MAKAVTKIDNMSVAEIDADIRSLWGAESGGRKAMRDICTEAAQAVIAGKYASKDLAAVGQRVYGLKPGADPATDDSFKSQSSKIAKCLKLAVRWNGAGLAVLNQAFDLNGDAYNPTLQFLSRIAKESKDMKAAPSPDDVAKWFRTEPAKPEKEVNNADVGEKIVAMLTELAEKDPNKSLAAALKAMGAYMDTAGMTTAEMRIAKDSATRKKAIADTLAKINAATGAAGRA